MAHFGEAFGVKAAQLGGNIQVPEQGCLRERRGFLRVPCLTTASPATLSGFPLPPLPLPTNTRIFECGDWPLAT